MLLHPNHFFPKYKKGERINLNNWLQSKHPETNPLDNDAITRLLAEEFPDTLTFGGYLENRAYMFGRTYLAVAHTFVHLGVDINAPRSSDVHIPFPYEVVDSWVDPDPNIGWGGRLVIRNNAYEPDEDEPLLILAHLNPSTIPEKGTTSRAGIIAQVGKSPENGGTFDHLHIQVINRHSELGCLSYLDGYGHGSIHEQQLCPNPENTEF